MCASGCLSDWKLKCSISLTTCSTAGIKRTEHIGKQCAAFTLKAAPSVAKELVAVLNF